MDTIKPRKTKKHYVNNADFVKAIIEYKAQVSINPETRMSNYIGLCIKNICEKMSTRPNFIMYTFRDEMVLYAIENCFMAIKNFDPAKSVEKSRSKTVNAFGYLSRIAWNAFLRKIEEEQEEQYLKHKNMQNLLVEYEDMFEGDRYQTYTKNNDLSDNIIKNFEDKTKKPKKKPKPIGLEKFVEEKENETRANVPDTASG